MQNVLRRMARSPSRHLRTLLRTQLKENTKISKGDLPGNLLSITKTVIVSLHPLVGMVPGFGYQLQELLDLGTALISKVEQVRAWNTTIVEICQKLQHVFEMVEFALQHRSCDAAPKLKTDLENIKQILLDMHEFVERMSKRSRILRFFSCSSDYQSILEYDTRLDSAIKMLLINSAIHLRLGIRSLQETVQSVQSSVDSVESLVRSVESSVCNIEAQSMSNSKRLDSYSEDTTVSSPQNDNDSHCKLTKSPHSTLPEIHGQATHDEEPGGVKDDCAKMSEGLRDGFMLTAEYVWNLRENFIPYIFNSPVQVQFSVSLKI